MPFFRGVLFYRFERMKYLLGYKKIMTQAYDGDEAVPVTVVMVPDNKVCYVRIGDGSTEVRVGVGKKNKPTKAEVGQYKDLGFVPKDTWTILGVEEKDLKVGDTFSAKDFEVGDHLRITGITKSKGFAGVVKRYGFAGGPRTRGQSDRQRAPGSIGAGTDPGRVLPGKKMPGRMGGDTQTFLDRKVVDVGDDYILVKGSLPGNSGGLLKMEIIPKDED